jgi:hypothetical protein
MRLSGQLRRNCKAIDAARPLSRIDGVQIYPHLCALYTASRR